MTDAINQGDAILFMKVGTHANEELESIIERKQREIADAGFSMWGYGGNTCHPATVQPFARARDEGGRVIRLCMQPMTSRHFAKPVRAEEFSVDRLQWEAIPAGINVLGSRFALCIRTLELVDWTLNLGDTHVAVGRSKGQVGDQYIKGRVDKACLEVDQNDHVGTSTEIRLVGELVEPYAVYLRNPEGKVLD